MTAQRNQLLSEMIKDLILSEFPHLQGEVRVIITQKPVFYEVRKGVGINVEIGEIACAHPRRRQIFGRAACACQEIHAGLTHAVKVVGLDEAHV